MNALAEEQLPSNKDLYIVKTSVNNGNTNTQFLDVNRMQIEVEYPEFPKQTMNSRVPRIFREVGTSLALNNEQESRLNLLIEDIENGRQLPSLSTRTPLEVRNQWNNFEEKIQSDESVNWLNGALFENEMYAYACLLDVVDAYQQGIDPFETKKKIQYENPGLWETLHHFVVENGQNQSEQFLMEVLRQMLIGNRGDLAHPASQKLGSEWSDEYLVLDDRKELIELLKNNPDGVIDIVADNSGIELVSDLIGIYHLLKSSQSRKINYHVKSYPVLVSDTTVNDFENFLVLARNSEHNKNGELDEFLDYIDSQRNTGRLNVQTDVYWNSGKTIEQIPKYLKDQFHQSALVILKGDMNFRRSIGCTNAYPQMPIDLIIGDALPSHTVYFRTFKSANAHYGMLGSAIRKLMDKFPRFQTDGKHGAIHFVPHRKRSYRES